MLKVGGFNELSPNKQYVYDNIISIIENNYSSFGYEHINTPAVERNDVLLAKSGNEVSKQIFGLYGLAQGTEDIKDYSLRFDLTVPLARYILDWQNELTFPFKRYQIQSVWRGERQQKGRSKEFFQADVDVIWDGKSNKNYTFYDGECIFLLYKTLCDICNYLDLGNDIFININNRNILKGFLNSIVSGDENTVQEVFDIIDDYYKIGEEEFIKKIRSLGISENSCDKLIAFLNSDINSTNINEFYNFVENDLFNEGIKQIHELLSNLDYFSNSFGININYNINLFIVRGLDYYTGNVFETFLSGSNSSICSGGRYDNITSHIQYKSCFSGFGGSIGVDRLFELYCNNIQGSSVVYYMFLNFENTRNDIYSLFADFVNKGYNCEIYPFEDNLKKQFQYADKKGVKKVVIMGDGEKQKWVYKIRDMSTGDEEEIKLT